MALVDYTRRKFRKKAVAAIAELDRTPLGIFAVGEEHLIHAVMLNMLNRESTRFNDFGLLLSGGITAINSVAGESREALRAANPIKAVGELRYWQKHNDYVGVWNEGFTGSMMNDDAKRWSKFLVLAATYTAEQQNYVRLGIMDTVFINQCIADDIHPEMALAMMSV